MAKAKSADQTGERVRLFRKHRSLTQQELADRAGVNRNTIGEIEKGRGTSMRVLDAIAAALETSTATLLGGLAVAQQHMKAHLGFEEPAHHHAVVFDCGVYEPQQLPIDADFRDGQVLDYLVAGETVRVSSMFRLPDGAAIWRVADESLRSLGADLGDVVVAQVGGIVAVVPDGAAAGAITLPAEHLLLVGEEASEGGRRVTKKPAGRLWIGYRKGGVFERGGVPIQTTGLVLYHGVVVAILQRARTEGA